MAPSEQHGVDELFEIRNAYFLGNYQLCISEAQKLKSSKDETKLLRDVFMYRAYVAQKKFSVPLDEISASAPADLRAVKMLADYLSHENKRAKILSDMEEKLNKGTEGTNSTFLLIASHIYVAEGNVDSALRTLHSSDDLECMSAYIQCLLKIDRVDLALKEVKKLQEKDEDAIVTQMALAWTHMAAGKEKLQDAFYIYQEMIDKYGSTPLLMNAQASVLIMQQKYDQADSLLHESMEKDSNNPETLINLIVVTQHLGKPLEQCNRYINQLKDGFPNHPWTKEYVQKDKEFDRMCRQYEVSKA